MGDPICESFQKELLERLQLYVSAAESLTDFREWEVGITETPEVPDEEGATLGRLAPVAENAEFDIVPEADFRWLAEETVRRLRRELAAA
jgi:hypothetical protein